MRYAEIALALGKLGAELHSLLLLNAGFLGRLEVHPIVSNAIQPLNGAVSTSKQLEIVYSSVKNVPC